MKKLLTFTLVFISSLSFAQKTGEYSFGADLRGGSQSLRGIRPIVGLSAGRYYTKNLLIGINASYSNNSFPFRRYTRLYGSNPATLDNLTPFEELKNYKNRTLGANLFAKYYISDFRLRPFLYGELGTEMNFQKVIKTDGGQNTSTNSNLNYAIGGGFSYALNKGKTIMVEASYLLKNNTAVKSLLWSAPSVPSYSLKPSGQFRIGLQFTPRKK